MPHRLVKYPYLLLALAALSVVPTLSSAQASPGFAPAQTFAATAFDNLWTRTDSLVASQAEQRSWLWGPQPNSPGLMEDYAEGAGGKRLVQYFDKSRMEINDPSADPSSPFYVTNGLLTMELISGRMQVGNNTFVRRTPSRTNVTGDPGDQSSPTYADLAGVSNALGARPDPDRTGLAVTATLSRGGQVGDDPSKAALPGAKVAYYEKSSGHNVPQAMWDFLNSSGHVSVDGTVTNTRLMDPWFYASGLPISDAYWVKATIAGKPTDVLLQAYERRVITYVPTNPVGFKVEMGNIGQHYYDWRYKETQNLTPVPAPTQTLTPTAPPQPWSPANISRFAVDVVEDTSAATLDEVKSVGAGATRVEMPWSSIEPQRSSPAGYNWAYSDAVYQALSDHGLQPITLIDKCPLWACTRPIGPVRADSLGDFVDFMGAMVARYSKAPYNAHIWEMWNEPDGVGDPVPGTNKNYGWGSNADRYVGMLQAIRPKVKQADPQAMIVLGGIAYDNFQENGGPFNRHFLDDVLAAGGGQYLDALNFHYYPNNVHWCSFTDKLNDIRGKARAYGLDLPVISTETGLGSDPGFNMDIQSMYVLQAYAQTAGEGMLTTAWFVAHDYLGGVGTFQNYGLFDVSGRPKPASTVYRLAANMIGQRPPSRALNRNDGLTGAMRGYEFAADPQHQGTLWVLWAWDQNPSGHCGSAPPPINFAIPAALAPSLSRVLDMYGQPVTPSSRADGSLVLPLDARPAYLEWAR
jgi:hypothetical protein